MIRLGLVGYPLEHSFSPILHQAAFQACDLQGEYLLYPVAPDDTSALAHLLNRVRTRELTGLNVTIPHKQAVIRFLDELTPIARAVGAVNTVCLRDGKLCGDNTDARGFLTDLRQFLSIPSSSIIFGAGGSARAVTYALRSVGCRVIVVARRIEAAQELAAQFKNVGVVKLNLQTFQPSNVDLIVNATPVGMFPNVDQSPWPSNVSFPEDTAVYDLIYNPRETLLVRQARAAGLKAITGLGMLIEQAALSFELWTGFNIPRGVMFDAFQQTVH